MIKERIRRERLNGVVKTPKGRNRREEFSEGRGKQKEENN